jgi:hypothetical protein
MEYKTEGVILQTIPYQEHHRIAYVFTQDMGMISLLIPGVSKPKLLALITPLTQLELVCRKKKSELFFLKEGYLVENYYFLRASWNLLQSAGKLGTVILKSQMPEKKAPKLYQLLTSCLKQLPRFQEPSTLLLLFYLKFLMHEGMIAWDLPTLFPYSYPFWTEPVPELKLQLKKLAFSRSFQTHYGQTGYTAITLQLEQVIRALFYASSR